MSYIRPTTGGKLIAAIPVTSNVAAGFATLNQLEAYGVRRPSEVESAKARDLKHDKNLAGAHDLRDQVQRRFDNARKKRAVEYSHYLEGILDGDLRGGTPPVTLYNPYLGADSDGGIAFPYNSVLVPIDGETQTEARFLLRDRRPETGDDTFAVMIYHGMDALHAGNIMHDYNTFAHPVAEKQTAALNSNGSVTRAVNMALHTAGVDMASVNRKGEAVLKGHVTSFGRLLAGALGYEIGKAVLRRNGLKGGLDRYNKGRHTIDEAGVQPFLGQMIGLAQADRAIAKAHPFVWALIGAATKSKGRPLTAPEILAANAAFAAGKGVGKLAAAGKAIGCEVP
jgi:hypothetical protein